MENEQHITAAVETPTRPKPAPQLTKPRKAAVKTAKPKPKKDTGRVPIPWGRLKKLWDAGESYERIAKLTDPRYDPKKPDPTHGTRAKISRALTKGVRIDGRLVRFKPRAGMRAIGMGKKVPKPKKVVKKPAKKKKAVVTKKSPAPKKKQNATTDQNVTPVQKG
jgi:hypothetical protein